MTIFLVIVSLTGSAIAFHKEIDGWLNPGMVSVEKREAPLLDPFTLREMIAARYPDESFDNEVDLRVESGRAVRYFVTPRTNAGDHTAEHSEDHGLGDLREWFFDPYTGEKLGERYFLSGPTLERMNLMGFLFRLHYSLSAPWGWNFAGNNVGGFILGATALIWTVDCFIAFCLTFPLRLRSGTEDASSTKSWWSRWKPAWLIKAGAGAYRLNLDVHRAFGLWTWAMLFVFAWSGVHFNMDQVYTPTMAALFGVPPPAAPAPARSRIESPKLGWREAYAQCSQRMRAEAARRGFKVDEDRYFSLDRDSGEYTLVTSFTGDVNGHGANSLSIDADTGAPVSAFFESDFRGPDTITLWLVNLHDAGVFGLPMRIIVCIMGLVITALSITGVYIWLKKRIARKISRLARTKFNADAIA